MTTTLPTATPAPIACTLTPGEFAGRSTWIADLNRAALREYHRVGLTLSLNYAPDALRQVHELVQRERECCAFLDMQVQEHEDGIRLTITAPAETEAALDSIFSPFLAGAATAPADAGRPSEHAAAGPAGAAGGSRSRADRVPAITAGTAAVAALACGVCCVLPFALPAVAVATFGGALAAFGRVYPWVAIVAVAAVTGAWFWVGLQSFRTRRKPAAATLRGMGLATMLLGVALSWPYLEPFIGRLLKR